MNFLALQLQQIPTVDSEGGESFSKSFRGESMDCVASRVKPPPALFLSTSGGCRGGFLQEEAVIDFSPGKNSLAQILEFPYPRATPSLTVVTPDLMIL